MKETFIFSKYSGNNTIETVVRPGFRWTVISDWNKIAVTVATSTGMN